MISYYLILCSFLIIFSTVGIAQKSSPYQMYGALFVAVQNSNIFEDDKTFPDCTPLHHPKKIMMEYNIQSVNSDFDLKKFVLTYFQLPDNSFTAYKTNADISINAHIDTLWGILTQTNIKTIKANSLITLPNSYVVPGGRFRELFYWDSYFIMLGLQVSGKNEMLKNMLDDFKFLIDSLGYIPNGNRTYFLSRSQPPYYPLMVDLIAQTKPSLLVEYLPSMEKEYNFWMNGSYNIKHNNTGYKRVVKMNDGEFLNRYWDDIPMPRPESYTVDKELAQNLSPAKSSELYRNIRAACESGWDFSSRWNKDNTTLQSIQIVNLIPVDLNCLLYFMEQTLSKAYKQKGIESLALKYENLANDRKKAILKYCWNEKLSFFMDYNFKTKTSTGHFNLAASYPLFFNIATKIQAKKVAEILEKDFLKPGGFATTLIKTEFQWDKPNGWAPLQWSTIQGLKNYNYNELATKGAKNWTSLNERVFKNTGKMMEKYNLEDTNSLAGGGEYELQDGFGWTNGVYLKLKSIYPE